MTATTRTRSPLALRRHARRQAIPTCAPSGLVTSGVVELAAGALTGWLHALAAYDNPRARRLGVQNAARVRQGHLDLAMLGTATIALGLAVPAAPRWAQRALGVGAWTNAVLFFPLAFHPDLMRQPAYRGLGLASFMSTSVGFGGMAVTALRRRRASAGDPSPVTGEFPASA